MEIIFFHHHLKNFISFRKMESSTSFYSNAIRKNFPRKFFMIALARAAHNSSLQSNNLLLESVLRTELQGRIKETTAVPQGSTASRDSQELRQEYAER